MGLCPIPCGGFAPATRKNLPMKVVFEGSLPLPLVGPQTYTLFGWLSCPRVTFSFDPSETGLSYIVK
jgi:hypothetical protein